MSDITPQPDLDRLCRAVVDTSPLLYCVIDEHGRVVFANPASELLLGYPPADLVGMVATDLIEPGDLETALDALSQIVTSGTGVPGQVPPMPMRLRHRDGTTVPLDVGAVDALDQPDVRGIIIRGRPMNGQQLLDQALESLVSSSPLDEVLTFLDAALTADLPGSHVAIAHDWNGTGFRATTGLGVPPGLDGLDRREPVAPPSVSRDGGEPTRRRVGRADPPPWIEAVERGELVVHADLTGVNPAIRAEAEANGLRACWALPVRAATGDAPLACILVWREPTGEPWVSQRVSLERTAQLTSLAMDRQRQERDLRHAALHDALTGVPNRASFFAHLEQIATEPPAEWRTAVLYLDLDGFKLVNDTFGHQVGDELLKVVSTRITDSLRPGDLVARLGGDEFSVVLHQVADPTEAGVIADRLIQTVGQPVVIDGHEVQVGLSVGVALADRAGDTVAGLVDAADRALYQAKQAGKGRTRIAEDRN